MNGITVKGIRQLLLYSFALYKPPEQKIFKRARTKLCKK